MFFDAVCEAPPDAIFGMGAAFRADPRPHKVDLMVGIYKNNRLQPEMIPAVQKAKKEIFENDLLADYLPFEGWKEGVEALGELAFGDWWKKIQGKTFSAQTVGGTAALRLGGEFLAQEVTRWLYMPKPTWPNHRAVLERAGLQLGEYAYYNREKHRLDVEELLCDLDQVTEKAAVLFHVVCHNPTGCDPTEEEWKEIARACQKKKLLPFFDFAYQGFGENLAKDRRGLEIFLEAGHEMLVAYSCSKNFSLYCQRVGALFVVGKDSAVKGRIGSQVKRRIRTLYSNPPAHGIRVVGQILKSISLKAQWERELAQMQKRIAGMRALLVERLGERFTFLKQHKGMFSFADLDKSQVQRMIEEFAVYLIDNGRISVAGLNEENLDRVVEALLSVTS
ncbi:MAG: aspartate/tyrosine/aromatic aminotransferase [Chlamydiia bacterium]|nr:aspartate/tyrosine/aromatic aminotransferase [Chlamydiia bacterium]